MLPKGPTVLPSKLRPFRRSLGAYGVGQVLIVAGAMAMELSGSMLPMALAGSAALMLTAPLVRQIAQRRKAGAQPKA